MKSVLHNLVSLSFDDGREDTYRIAFQIMKKYGLVGSIHVTTGYVDETWKPKNWPSAVHGAMSIEQIKECYLHGFEITSHGDRHVTEQEDMKTSLQKLEQWGVVDRTFLGFSSPYSFVTTKNMADVKNVLESNNIAYLRTGRSSKCYTTRMKLVYLLLRITGSKKLYRIFNRLNTINKISEDMPVLTASVIKKHDTAEQVIEFIKAGMNKNEWNILMLHSILGPEDLGYGKDAWCWDKDEFEKLCRWLTIKNGNGISVVTLREGIKRIK